VEEREVMIWHDFAGRLEAVGRAEVRPQVASAIVAEGDLVRAGSAAPPLTTLVSVDPIYASFEADEETIVRVRNALPAGHGIDQIPIAIASGDNGNTSVRGELQFIDNVVDSHSGTVRIRARFANPDGRLIPGQFARLRLGQPQAGHAVAIDECAIGTDQGRRYVLVVGEDSKVVYRRVQLGAMLDGLRIVTDGLKAGERIVVKGLGQVRPGAVIAPQVVAMAATEKTAAHAFP
jgi:multidrug efflux system membrane fusion protein